MTHAKSGVLLAVRGKSGGPAGRSDRWNVYLFGMSRVGNETRWHLSIVGRGGAHTLTVKAIDAGWSLTPPDELLGAVEAWLAAGPSSRRPELVEL